MFLTDEHAEALVWGAIAFTVMTTGFYTLLRLKRRVACEMRGAMDLGRTG